MTGAIVPISGLDALTQLIEPYVSVRANPMTDDLCVEGIRSAARALPRVWDDGSDRSDLGPGRAHAVDRALRQRPGEPDDRRSVRRRHSVRGARAAPRLG